MAANVLLLSSGRKGTHVVLSALEKRRDVFVHEQVFSSLPPFLRGLDGPAIHRRLFDREYLQVGPVHMILPIAPTMEDYQDFWPAAAADPECRVVHLLRRNLLRRYLSLVVARQTGQWSTRYPRFAPEPAVEIDRRHAEREIRFDRQGEQLGYRLLPNNPAVTIYYEDLETDYEATMRRVGELIGLADEMPSPLTRKQSTLPLRKAIVNFDELARAWRGTDLETYLEL